MQADLWSKSDFEVGTLFDKVWVVSLVASGDRRAYVRDHLASKGIEHFEFFDATPADDPSVAEAMPRAAQFPPCFRCGKLDCGKPDCNNFLTAPQVACVLTYRRLWKAIAEGPHARVLVVEDDVCFHDWAPRVLAALSREVSTGRIPFRSGERCLLRLGWGRGLDHDAGKPFEVTSQPRMANPCHALTRDFARALVERCGRIDHTADVFQHVKAPQEGEAFTILPPVASELSWLTGQFDSTIHPRQSRVDYLKAAGLEAEARKASERLERHVRKKFFRPLLMVGHPRTGTGYAASLCRQLGVDVGHERAGEAGISSWMFTVDAEANPYALDAVARTRRALVWKWMVSPTRALDVAVPSIMRENLYAPPSFAFRRKHILERLDVDLAQLSPLEQAVVLLTSWMRIVMQQKPDLVFRIEDQADVLREFLIRNELASPSASSAPLDTMPVNANKKYKGVTYPKPEVTGEDWAGLSSFARAEVDWYCETFGYPAP